MATSNSDYISDDDEETDDYKTLFDIVAPYRINKYGIYSCNCPDTIETFMLHKCHPKYIECLGALHNYQHYINNFRGNIYCVCFFQEIPDWGLLFTLTTTALYVI